ncbi:MAG: 50S ribosomal protein L11 methyltransferase [bacterium]
MQWSEISVSIDREGVEAVANMFHELGAGGVVIEDPELINSYRAGGWAYEDLPSVGPERGVIVRAYLPVDSRLPVRLQEIKASVNQILSTLPHLQGKIEFRRVEDEDWAGAWKKYYQTTKLGDRLVIKPVWEQYLPSSEEIVIEIDPGMAFGTGTHPSTVMCLLGLEDYINGGERVIDIGTGSGILAIAAAKLGASAVIGIDCDPIAVKSARSNVELNQVADRVSLYQGDLLTGIQATADLIVANLTADLIKVLTTQLDCLLVPEGRAILGGIITARLAEVQDNLREAGYVTTETRTQDDWVTLVVQKER